MDFFKGSCTLIVYLFDSSGFFLFCSLRSSFLRSSLGLLLLDSLSLLFFGLEPALVLQPILLSLLILAQTVHVCLIDHNCAISLSRHELTTVPG